MVIITLMVDARAELSEQFLPDFAVPTFIRGRNRERERERETDRERQRERERERKRG